MSWSINVSGERFIVLVIYLILANYIHHHFIRQKILFFWKGGGGGGGKLDIHTILYMLCTCTQGLAFFLLFVTFPRRRPIWFQAFVHMYGWWDTCRFEHFQPCNWLENIEVKQKYVNYACMRVLEFVNLYYTGWPKKNATLLITNFKEIRD